MKVKSLVVRILSDFLKHVLHSPSNSMLWKIESHTVFIHLLEPGK